MPLALEQSYKEATRPYSQKELHITEDRLYKYLKLGDSVAYHSDCGHFYRVRINSKKETSIKESNGKDCGNCSVCWKLKNTERHLQKLALTVASSFTESKINGSPYNKEVSREEAYLTYDLIDLETLFYKWLNENTERKGQRSMQPSY